MTGATLRVPGSPNTIFACCDPWTYAHYGYPPGHANCRDNFIAALAALDIAPPVSKPGDFVILRALVDAVLVFSTCPMDVTPINGEGLTPRAVHYQVLHR